MTDRIVAESAAFLLIGSELLSGKVAEANMVELARALRALGISLRRAVVVLDDIDTIAEEIRELTNAYDVVFTSGGVGPTHDDVTIDAVARAFDTRVVSDPTMEGLLRTAYGERLTEDHLRMARVPLGSELLVTGEVPWPTVVMKNLWVLPGVPEIFRMKLAVLRARLTGPTPFFSKAAYTNMDEAVVKPLLDRIVLEHPSVEIGSYPKWFDPSYKTKVTFDARDGESVTRALKAFLELLPTGEPQRIE